MINDHLQMRVAWLEDRMCQVLAGMGEPATRCPAPHVVHEPSDYVNTTSIPELLARIVERTEWLAMSCDRGDLNHVARIRELALTALDIISPTLAQAVR